MTLTDEAIMKLQVMTLSGQIFPSDKLPKTEEFAAALGLSRSSLREAIRMLDFIGVLNARRGDGTYVTSLEFRLLIGRAADFAVDLLVQSTGLELLKVRCLLESRATALTMVRIGQVELVRLRECLQRINSASGVGGLVEVDDKFYSIIVGAAGKDTLSSLLLALSGWSLRARLWRGLSSEVAIKRIGGCGIVPL